jgi:hypothetical protein
VAGVLWYFPCEQDKESLPLGDEGPALSNYNMTQADVVMTQLAGQTQQQCLTQRPGNSPQGEPEFFRDTLLRQASILMIS